jgi:maleate isomerase
MSDHASDQPVRSYRLGVLTPSSNTVIEPLVAAMTAEAGATAHFARFSVTRISLKSDSLRQFDPGPMLVAASQLADARVDVIVWCGTSAGWLGFEADSQLVRAIEETTSIRGTTSVLALNDALTVRRFTRIALLTPYTDDLHSRIVNNFGTIGVDVVAGENLGISENFAFAEVPEPVIGDSLTKLARARPEVLVTFCTNLPAARLAVPIERATGIPLYDTVTAGVWRALSLAGANPSPLTAVWGSLFGTHPSF